MRYNEVIKVWSTFSSQKLEKKNEKKKRQAALPQTGLWCGSYDRSLINSSQAAGCSYNTQESGCGLSVSTNSQGAGNVGLVLSSCPFPRHLAHFQDDFIKKSITLECLADQLWPWWGQQVAIFAHRRGLPGMRTRRWQTRCTGKRGREQLPDTNGMG